MALSHNLKMSKVSFANVLEVQVDQERLSVTQNVRLPWDDEEQDQT
jgi:hypothetical protein